MHRVRPTRAGDLPALYELARRLGPGMTTFPADEPTLAAKIEASERSFAGSAAGGEAYLLLLEAPDRSIIGCAGVYPRAGLEHGFYSYRVCRHRQQCAVPAITLDLSVLNPVNDLTGWTEVGTLVVAPDARGRGFGRLLARARYLLMAQFPDRFEERVFAELRGWQSGDGTSPFWSAVGERFFGMPFDEADRLSATAGAGFIQALMPKLPLYVEMLPPAARDVIGRPHDVSRLALDMLIEEGFRRDDYVDVFDAGPQVWARRDELASVKESQLRSVRVGDTGHSPSRMLVSSTTLADFAVVDCEARPDAGAIILPPAAAVALGVADGDTVRAVPNRAA